MDNLIPQLLIDRLGNVTVLIDTSVLEFNLTGFRTTTQLVILALAIGAQRVWVRHGDDVVAGIDEMDFAGNAGGEV